VGSNQQKQKDEKVAALAKSGTLNPKSELVKDEAFATQSFFDPRDLLQVKYEMLRRVDHDGWSASQAAETFGLSRPSFYEAKHGFEKDGLGGLLPKMRGPKAPHKLSGEILDFVASFDGDATDTVTIATEIKRRFGIKVHPRSIGRAMVARKKKKLRGERE